MNPRLNSFFLVLIFTALLTGELANVNIASSQTLELTPTPTIAINTNSLLTSNDVAGFIDKDGRSPIITLSTETADEEAKILVDIDMEDGPFKDYPVEVKFYVNGELFSSQIRSVKLPRPLGITVPLDSIDLPFNYSIVASILHPNRRFSSLAEGAVFPPTPTALPESNDNNNGSTDSGNDSSVVPSSVTLNCSLEEDDPNDSANIITISNDVSTSFSTSNNGTTYNATISGSKSDGSAISADIEFDVTTLEENVDSDISGTVTFSEATDGGLTSETVTGFGFVNESLAISDLDVENNDGSLIVTCVSSEEASTDAAIAALARRVVR